MARGSASLLLSLCACRLAFDEGPPPVECMVALDAGAPRMNFNARRAIAVSGAREPLDFSVDSPIVAIDAATGTLSSFTVPGQVIVSVRDADGCTAETVLDIGGDVMWYAGGSVSSVPTRDVLRSVDGINWSFAGMLPDRRAYGALVTFRDRLWWFSGSDGTGVMPGIFVSDDGANWTLAGTVPTPASAFGFTVFRDKLWIVGGNNNTNRVYSSDDALTWTQVGALPMDNHGGALAAVGGQLIYSGGHNSSLYSWVLASPDGVTWQQVGTLAVPREYHTAFVIDDRMYIAGGQNTVPTALQDVTSTLDGATWSPTPALPAGRAFAPIVRVGDDLWSLGGTDGGGVWHGTPGGPWTPVSSTFPFPRQGGSAALFTPP